jgi:hypothetical protein
LIARLQQLETIVACTVKEALCICACTVLANAFQLSTLIYILNEKLVHFVLYRHMM